MSFPIIDNHFLLKHNGVVKESTETIRSQSTYFVVFLSVFVLFAAGVIFSLVYLNQPKKFSPPPPPSPTAINIPAVTPEAISSWVTYTNLDLKYSFKYPSSWVMKGPGFEGPTVYFWSNESVDSSAGPLEYFISTNVIVNKNKLSFKDLILSKLGKQNLKDQFKYTKEKIGQYEIYKTESLPSRWGELHAFITKDGSTYISISLNPYNSEKPFELQSKYLYLFDQILTTFTFIDQALNNDSTGSSLYADKNILSVTTDASNIYYSAKFPEGLFNRNANDWGLINYTNDPVKLSINFVKPVSVSSVEFIFTHCPDKDYPNGYTGETGCYYTVTVDGSSDENGSFRIIYPNNIYPTHTVDNIGPDVLDKTYYLNLPQQFTKMNITVKRLGNDLDDFVHLKKIYITYK